MSRIATKVFRARPSGSVFAKCWMACCGLQWPGLTSALVENWVRLFVGGLLLVASTFKVYGLLATGTASSPAGLPIWVTLSLLPVEVILGLLLVVGFWPQLFRISTLTLFSAFACYSMRTALHGHPSCGCFGRVTVSPWAMFFIDASVIAILLWWRPKSNRPGMIANFTSEGSLELPPLVRRVPLLEARLLAALIPCLTIGVPAGWIASEHRKAAGYEGFGEVFVAEPETWLDKELPLLANIDIGQELRQGDWIVLLYHYDCPKCQEAMAQYQHNGRLLNPRSPRIAFIEVPPYDPRVSPTDSACRRGRLDSSRDWFVETPTHLLVSAGVVRIISHGLLGLEAPLGEAATLELAGSRSAD